MSNVKEVAQLQVGLELNSKNFTKNMSNVNKNIKNSEKGFKILEKTIANGEKSVENYSEAINKGSKALDGHKKKITILEKEQESLTKTVEKQRASYDKLQSELTDATKEYDKLKKSVGATEEELAGAKKAIDDMTKKLDESGAVINKNIGKIEQYGNQVAETKMHMNQMTTAVSKMASRLKDLGTDEAIRELARLDSALNIDTNKLISNVSKINSELDSVESGKAVQEMDKLENSFDGLDSGLSGVADKLNDMIEPVDMIVGALGGAGLVNNFTTLENLSAKLQASLGLSADEANNLDDVVRNLAGNGYGFEPATEAVIELKRVLGDVSDGELETLAGQAIALSDTFDGDVNEIVRASTQLMKQFGIEGEDAFDIIGKGYQDGANFSGEWLDNLSEYSVQLKMMGYTAEDALKIAIAGFEEGNWNLDKTLDLAKEGRIRLAEMGDGALEAVESLGLSSAEINSAIASGGEAGKKAMTDVAQALVNVEDEVLRNQLGVAIMGTQYEDLGINGVKALLAVNNELEGVDGTAQGVADTMGDTLDADLLTIANNFALAFKDITEALKPIVGYIADLSGKFKDWITGLDEGSKAFLGFATIAGLALAPLAGVLLGIFEKIMNIKGAMAEMSKTTSGKIKGLKGDYKDLEKEIDNVKDTMKIKEEDLKYALSIDSKEAKNKVVEFSDELDELGATFDNLNKKQGDIKGEIIGLGGSFEEAGDETSKLKGKFNELKDMQWKDVGNKINDGITTPIKDAGKSVKENLVGALDNVKSFDFKKIFSVSGLTATLSGMGTSIMATISGLGASIAGVFAGIGTAITGALSIIFAPVTLIIGAIVALAGSFVYAWNKSEEFRNNVMATFQNLKDAVAEILGAIWSIFEPAVTAITNWWKENSDTILAVCETVWNGILSVINFVIDILVPMITGFINNIKSVISIGMSIIQTTFGTVWETIKGVFQTALALIKGIVSGDFEGMKNAIKEIWSKVWENLKEIWSNMVNTVKEKLGEIISNIKEKASEIIDNIKAPFESAINWVKEKWQGLKDLFSKPFKVTVDKSEVEGASFDDTSIPAPQGLFTIPAIPDLSRLGSKIDLSPVEFKTPNGNRRNTKDATVDALKEQNSLLKQMMEIMLQEKRTTLVENTINLDGRAIAQGTAKYVGKEISNLNRRKSRIAGLAY